MKCREVTRLIAAREPLPAGADEHLRKCPGCALLLAAPGGAMPHEPLDPELERRLVAIAHGDGKPTAPLGRAWIDAAVLSGMALAVAALGIAALGITGWTLSSTALRLYLGGVLAAGLLSLAFVLAQMMRPGALLRVAPAPLIAVLFAALGVAAALYPVLMYPQFARAAAACFSIGVGHAALVAALATLVLRRGLLLAPWWEAMAGLFCGLTGLTVLFVFCPHPDLGHYLLGHVSVAAASAAFGPAAVALARRLQARR